MDADSGTGSPGFNTTCEWAAAKMHEEICQILDSELENQTSAFIFNLNVRIRESDTAWVDYDGVYMSSPQMGLTPVPNVKHPYSVTEARKPTVLLFDLDHTLFFNSAVHQKIIDRTHTFCDRLVAAAQANIDSTHDSDGGSEISIPKSGKELADRLYR